MAHCEQALIHPWPIDPSPWPQQQILNYLEKTGTNTLAFFSPTLVAKNFFLSFTPVVDVIKLFFFPSDEGAK